MKKLILFLTIIAFASAFNCTDANSSDYCSVMDGCSWTSHSCTGSFKAKCKEDLCLYIFPSSNQNSSNGTVKYPFQYIQNAINSTQVTNKTNIYLLNLPNQDFFMDDHAEFIGNKTFTILPYFNITTCILNITMNLKMIPMSPFTNIKFQDLEINMTFKDTLFSDSSLVQGSHNCSLEFVNTKIYSNLIDQTNYLVQFQSCAFKMKNVTIEKDILFYGFQKKENAKKDLQVYIDGLNQSNINSSQELQDLFLVENANFTIKNSQFNNIQLSKKVLSSNLYLFRIIHTKANFQNITFNNVKANILFIDFESLSLKNISIKNIQGQNTFNIFQSKKDSAENRAKLTNISITTVKVSQNVFKIGSNITFHKLSMKNLIFYPIDINDYFFTSPNGVCMFIYDGITSINYGLFYNLSNSCIFSHQSTLKVNNSLFQCPIIAQLAVIDLPFSPLKSIGAYIHMGKASTRNNQASIVKLPSLYVENTIFQFPIEFPGYFGNIVIQNTTQMGEFVMNQCIMQTLQGIDYSGVHIEQHSSIVEIFQFNISNSIFGKQPGELVAGSALYAFTDSPSFLTQTIQGNIFISLKQLQVGGAITTHNFNTRFSQNVFIGNRANYGGAMGIFGGNYSVVEEDNLIFFNFARALGGAIVMPTHDQFKVYENITGINTNYDMHGLTGISVIKPPSWVLNTYNFNSNLNLFIQFLDGEIEQGIQEGKIISYNSSYTAENISKFEMTFSPGHPFPLILEFTGYMVGVNFFLNNSIGNGKFQQQENNDR